MAKLTMIEAIRAGLDADGDGDADLDADRMVYAGHSLGGIMAPEFVALTDAYATLSYENLGSFGKLYPCPEPEISDGTVVMFGKSQTPHATVGCRESQNDRINICGIQRKSASTLTHVYTRRDECVESHKTLRYIKLRKIQCILIYNY